MLGRNSRPEAQLAVVIFFNGIRHFQIRGYHCNPIVIIKNLISIIIISKFRGFGVLGFWFELGLGVTHC